MRVHQRAITVRDLAAAYADDAEGGVTGYGGRLDIRPPYQREFVYNPKQRDSVIETITKGFPLNVMNWAVREDGTFEVIDGQQRTISICQYVTSEFSVSGSGETFYFHNLHADEQEAILDYELTVYECSGTDREKLEWFEIINTAGEELTQQELRNAVYSGTWLSDAKRSFSKTYCWAYKIATQHGRDYLHGKAPIRQEYLETVLRWISAPENGGAGDIRKYMAAHQHDANADPLRDYFEAVIAWANLTFPTWRREMRGLAWGDLYNRFRADALDPVDLERQVAVLMADDEVTKKSGIFEYVLSKDAKHLNLRAFPEKEKRQAYDRQKGICGHCNEHFAIDKMEADHITPWHEGGKTDAANCQMLCQRCNRRKGGR